MLREEIIRIKASRQLGLKDEEYERIISLLGGSYLDGAGDVFRPVVRALFL